MDALKIIDPGPMTTIQDLGRFGYQRFGLPVCGALDDFSARMANLLVGNHENAALLEITFMGFKAEVLCDCRLALCGAEMPMSLNGESASPWTTHVVKAGNRLELKPAVKGLRGYLAVSGGIDVPLVMGSRSTYAGAKIGGLDGRILKKGDVLPKGDGESSQEVKSLPQEFRPVYEKSVTLRALPGPQDDFFDQGLEVFFSSVYKISTKADRMGYRLEGPKVELKPDVPVSIISEPSLSGAVQVPPDGQPIILLIEQTVGGYVKIATVLKPDINLVAQARPGEEIKFAQVDLDSAREAHQEYLDRLNRIRELLGG